MKVIIDIDEEQYEFIKQGMPINKVIQFPALMEAICEYIANGTQLPKGHGRILDEKDILDTENNDGGFYDLVDMPEYIAGVKAIIEAEVSE